MKDLITNVENASRELLARLMREAAGFPYESGLDAAANMLVNVIRQNAATGKQAELVYDALMYRTKEILMQHYQGKGKRRSLFPYTQHVRPDIIKNKNEFF